jgi:hypothetical protein
MGGLRVVFIDALFLRAEALRAKGRFDEVPALYRTVLALDPGNAAAYDHLAAVTAYDVLPLATTLEDRIEWWNAAYELVVEGLRANPGSARLLYRQFDLFRTASLDRGLRSAVAEWLPEGEDPELFGLERLGDAVRKASDIPGAGRVHLLAMALWAPQLAAERVAAGRQDAARAIAAGRAAVLLRGGILAEMTLPSGLDLRTYLESGLDAVVEVGVAATPEGRRAAFEAYRSKYPDSPLVEGLRAAAER